MNTHIDGGGISAFLDGALAASERARVESHLSSCGDCRRELESLRRLKLALSCAPRKAMPADLALAIARRLVAGAPWWAALARPALWVPTGALAAALTIGLWLRSSAGAEDLPLELLLAAHARYSAETLMPEEHLVASTYSDQMNSLYSDAPNAELE